MTVEEGFFYQPLSLKYVLLYRKASMLSSHSSLEDLSEEWECLDCAGPPPRFYLPPPPCPPGVDASVSNVPWTCPLGAGGRGEATATDPRVSIAVVVITAATCILLAAVAAVIVCRRRLHREGRGSKATPMDGAIIYDDLTAQSGPTGSITAIDPGGRPQQVMWTPVGPRAHPRYVQPPTLGGPHVRYKIARVEEPHLIGPTFAEPVYQSISSASGSGMSSQCPSEGGRVPMSSPSPRLRRESESEEDDSLTPFLPGTDAPEDSDSPRSPSHARYYLSVRSGACFRPPSASSSTHTSSHEYETLPLRVSIHGASNIQGGRPLTPQERGLPPLPSRSARFRMFLPHQEKHRQPQDRRLALLPHKHTRSPSPVTQVLYENIGLSSQL